MTKKNVLTTLAAGLVLGGISIAGPRLAGGDECSKECPIGSRLGDTLDVVSDVLERARHFGSAPFF